MKTSLEKLSLQELASMYEEAAAAHGQSSESGDHRKANAQFRRIDAVWKELRTRGSEGPGALSNLMDHANLHVRGWAASHALESAPRAAESVLEMIANGPPGIARFNAEMTLREWRAGNLKFD
ncbi:DUF2019 domain-containing protein [Corallococcus terminator]